MLVSAWSIWFCCCKFWSFMPSSVACMLISSLAIPCSCLSRSIEVLEVGTLHVIPVFFGNHPFCKTSGYCKSLSFHAVLGTRSCSLFRFVFFCSHSCRWTVISWAYCINVMLPAGCIPCCNSTGTLPDLCSALALVLFPASNYFFWYDFSSLTLTLHSLIMWH